MRPLIAIAGEFWDGATALGLAKGFDQAGFDIAQFDSRAFTQASDGDIVLRAIGRLAPARRRARYNKRIRDACALERPDIFLAVKGVELQRDTLEQIRAAGTRLALFYPDVAFDHPGLDASLFDLYDDIFTTKRFHLPWMAANLRHPRIHHVDHGYSTSSHLVQPGDETGAHRYDVSYVGSASDYKLQWLAALKTLRPDLALTVAGVGWTKRARGTALAPCVLGRALEGAMFRRFITRSRINIAVHFGPVANGWQDTISTRTFQIPAARGFMLHIDNDEVRNLFEVGSEIDTFRSPEELAEKIDFYLAHPQQCATMIDAAYARAVPSYSYETRVAQMIDAMRNAGPNAPAHNARPANA